MSPRDTIVAAFVEHEWRTQLRSPRFLAVASAYALLAAIPPWTVFRFADVFYVASEITAVGLVPLPGLTLLISSALSYDAIFREHATNSFSVSSLTPLSSAGFVFRRWIALLSLLLPLTLVGPVSTFLAIRYAGVPTVSMLPIVNSWGIHLVPLAIVASAIALAAGTIARSLVGAGILLMFLNSVFLSSVAWAMEKLGVGLPASGSFFGIDPHTLYFVKLTLRGTFPNWLDPLVSYSPSVLLGRLAPQIVLPLGGGLLLLALSTLYLSRTRPDLPPMRIRDDHPFRSYLRQWNRFRVFIRPDAGSGPWERVSLVAGIILLSWGSLWVTHRYQMFRNEANSRYEVERSEEPLRTTSSEFLPDGAQLRGAIREGGHVEMEGEIRFVNHGGETVDYLALMLHPAMTLQTIEIDGRQFRHQRSRDRIWGHLSRPVEPGASMLLSFSLEGRPDTTIYFTGSDGGDSFVRFWENWGANQGIPLANNYRLPMVARALTTIPAEALMPLPRYTTWKLTPVPRISRDPGLEVREETYVVSTEIDANIEVPFQTLDSCGNLSSAGMLDSSCHYPLHEFGVVAGDVSIVETEEIRVVALRDYEHLAEFHLAGLEDVARTARERWPGLPWSKPSFIISDRTLHGDFISVSPWDVARKEIWRSTVITGNILFNRLLRSRELEPSQTEIFRAFYGTLAEQLTGSEKPATLAFVPTDSTPPIEYDVRRAKDRLEPIVSALIHRLGDDLPTGINHYFTKEGPGSIRELFESLEEASGKELNRFFEDFILGSKLPRPELDTVETSRSSRGWSVRASMTNRGTGEAVCPVVLATDVNTVERWIVAREGETVTFELETRQRPRSLRIDPDHRCYRLAGPGLLTQRNIES